MGGELVVEIEAVGDPARAYSTPARLTASHVVTEAGLRFSRATGKETGDRRGRRNWRLSAGSLDSVRVGAPDGK